MEALKGILESEWIYHKNVSRPFWIKGSSDNRISIERAFDYLGRKIVRTYHIWFEMDDWRDIINLFDGNCSNQIYAKMKFDNMEEAKQHVDQFLERIIKMKAFL